MSDARRGALGSALPVALFFYSALCLAGQPEVTAGGVARNQAIYLAMQDGVRIAVDLWLPADLAPGARVPAIIKATTYWRAIGLADASLAAKVLGALNVAPSEDFNKEEADRFNRAGYALVYVDARGSGASFGRRSHPCSQQELSDYGEIISWITAQPWSNGCVAAMGNAYEGTAAEMMLALGRSELKAVAPLFSDFDPWSHLIAPGGVRNEWFLRYWRDGMRMLDTNDLSALAAFKGIEYQILKRLITGVKPVDADTGGALLAAALQSRAGNGDVYHAGCNAEFRDDPFGEDGPAFPAFSPCGRREQIEASGAPMYIWAGWMDAATVAGVLARFKTFDNPQRVVIGPWGHAGRHDANPYANPKSTSDPSREARDRQLISFFDDYLKGGTTMEPPAREIRYFTMGENEWKTTDTWPPTGIATQRWYFSPEHVLATEPPQSEQGADTYTVNFEATTGDTNRWRTQADGADVVYPDRAKEDQKLLVYTSAPLDRDIEITGTPIVTLFVSSTESDGAFFAYLEDVAPDGRVTYLTEGMLRAIHRKISETGPYAQSGPCRTFARADAEPLVPGETAEITFDLIPTSVLIRAGHRIRVAIAGHDQSCFARYPAHGTPILTVSRNTTRASFIELPMLAR